MYITLCLILLKCKYARGTTQVACQIVPSHHRVFVMTSAKGLWGAQWTENPWLVKCHNNDIVAVWKLQQKEQVDE